MIDYTHSRKREFGVWTTNVESIAKQYINWGVDYLTTDYYNFIKDVDDQPASFD
jgi:glycerophosphoryl diester phosphodiesterase